MSTPKKLSFHGDGTTFFVMSLVNLLLSSITLSIYSFWAIAKNKAYIYQNTEFAGSRFAFHGTGEEMFKGAIKAIGLLLGVGVVVFALAYYVSPVSVLLFYIFLFLVAPYAIHGSLKYNLSKTSWRGIHMGYRGDLQEFTKLFYVEMLLTIITFGIYGSWASVKLQKYIMGNVRIGNVGFAFKGEGDKYFMLNLVGILLSAVTFGIYYPKYYSKNFNYLIDNTKIIQDGNELHLKGTTTGTKVFMNFLLNVLLIVFTLGIAFPWVVLKEIKFVYENVEIDGDLNVDNIVQTEENYNNSTGDGLSQLLGLEI